MPGIGIGIGNRVGKRSKVIPTPSENVTDAIFTEDEQNYILTEDEVNYLIPE
jgi:hypothetical protein